MIGKLATFMIAEVNLQWQLSVLTLLLAALGHFLCLKAYSRLVGAQRRQFNKTIGLGLCTVSILGLWSAL